MDILKSTFYDNKTGYTGFNQFISVLRQKGNKTPYKQIHDFYWDQPVNQQ